MSKVTIESIDKVLKRLPNATYKQAKEALEKTDGSIVDAIIYLQTTYSELNPNNDKNKELKQSYPQKKVPKWLKRLVLR